MVRVTVLLWHQLEVTKGYVQRKGSTLGSEPLSKEVSKGDYFIVNSQKVHYVMEPNRLQEDIVDGVMELGAQGEEGRSVTPSEEATAIIPLYTLPFFCHIKANLLRCST